MKNIKYIVWDWNGTLIDDVDCAVQTMNTLLKEYGIRQPLCRDEYLSTFAFPVVDYYEALGFDTKGEEFPGIARRFVELYDQNYVSCHLHEGAIEVMKTLQERGIKQIILSATEKNNLLKQVANFSVAELVEEALGIEDIYAGSKEYLAVDWLKKNEINPEQVLFIGDTTHDYEVGNKTGCHCLLLAKGHQSRAVLIETGNDVLEHHEDILEYILS